MAAGTAIIIGAGPAGLTAAWELQQRTGLRPVVLEASEHLGGISRTVEHRGNRIDIGGHRFFSKSDRVMAWWLDRMPLQQLPPGAVRIAYQNQQRAVAAGEGPDPARTDRVMLVRGRQSRIFYQGRFFRYPVSLDPDTLRKLGLRRTTRIAASYARASLLPRPEHNLEDFLVNRFGRELYRTFFQEYTEKVWGIPCSGISAEWGAQRIKGLSLRKALTHFLRQLVPGGPTDLAQKGTETSLIEQFLYPKLGPGQMWEIVAEEVQAAGGEVLRGWRVVEVLAEGRRVRGVVAEDAQGQRRRFEGEQVFSTMPMKHLVRALSPHVAVPGPVREVSEGLVYRDFITVGLLLDRLAVEDPAGGPLRDNWIYVQEPGVQVGRIQLFHNWSPWLVADPATTWLGLEYFCNVGDRLWSRSDEELRALGERELVEMGLARPGAVRDGVVIRMPKTYPAYFGSYDRFDTLRRWLDGFENLWLLGRNGMHRYNNQDHSMLTAMTAVEQVAAGRADKAPLWAVNTEQEYHEEK